MSIEAIGVLVTGIVSVATAVGSFVYARTRDATVAFWKEQAANISKSSKEAVVSITQERDDWKARHEADRLEIHGIREQWNHDRIELERLRAETNFSPIESKLNVFMDGQNKVNAGLMDRLDKVTDAQNRMAETFAEQTKTFVDTLERLVPELRKEQIEEQEKPI
jgi:hypothetical protein